MALDGPSSRCLSVHIVVFGALSSLVALAEEQYATLGKGQPP